MTARTSYGLDTPRGEHWGDRAACASPKVDPEWWWTENGPLAQDGMRALHICQSHCPVRSACHKGAVNDPPRHPCIQGGHRYIAMSAKYLRTVATRDEPTTTYGCPYCAGEAS